MYSSVEDTCDKFTTSKTGEKRETEKQPLCVKSDCLMYTCELTCVINVSIKQQEAFPCVLIVTSVISPCGYTVSNRCKERVTDYLNIYFNLISHPRATVAQQSYFSALKNHQRFT